MINSCEYLLSRKAGCLYHQQSSGFLTWTVNTQSSPSVYVLGLSVGCGPSDQNSDCNVEMRSYI